MSAMVLACALGLAEECVRSEVAVGTSIEWLSISSDLIVRGEFSDSREETGRSGSWRVDTYSIAEVIKGEGSDPTIEITFPLLLAPPLEQVREMGPSLLFLRRVDPLGTTHHGWPGEWTWSGEGYCMTAVSLQAPVDVFGKDMVILTDPEVIEEVVREWSGSDIVHSLRWEVPEESPIFARLYGGSAVYLIVPAEERYRSHFEALARSDRPYERAVAAADLHKYPGESTVAILRELLEDDTEFRGYFAADNFAPFTYGVRAAAYRSLTALGVEVDEPVVERLPTDPEQRELREAYWTRTFQDALPVGWAVMSVMDGETRADGGESRITQTLLTVELTDGAAQYRLILVPKDWRDAPPPETECLGFINAQCGRRFYLQGAMPQEVRERIARYFSLQGDDD